MLDLDEVYREIGELGRGQWWAAAPLFALYVSNPRHTLQYTFVGYPVPFECVPKKKGEEEPLRSQCPEGSKLCIFYLHFYILHFHFYGKRLGCRCLLPLVDV